MAGYIREDEKAIVSIDVRVDNNASISFNIIDPKEKDMTIYSISEGASDDQTIYTDVIFKNENNQEDCRHNALGYDGIGNV